MKYDDNKSMHGEQYTNQRKSSIGILPISCITSSPEGFFCLNPVIIFQLQLTKHRQRIGALVIHLQSIVNLWKGVII
jgi:hypothetical protein